MDMENKLNIAISVVTYKRLGKWINILRNLRKVRSKCPKSLNVDFVFIEDSKSPRYIFIIKKLLAKLTLFNRFQYMYGKDNLGESRDYSIEYLSTYGDQYTWFGFIDDDDYYRTDILKVLEPYFTKSGNLIPNVINFCMSGNFHVLSNPYQGYPEHKNRLRKWDDKNFFGCIPSMACFIRLSEWRRSKLKFGYNPPSEETSPLMIFTYESPNVAHVGIELMFRNRAKNSLVRDLSIYNKSVISSNILTHINNLREYSRSDSEFRYLYKLFKYNYGGYLKSHGASWVDEVFNNVDNLINSDESVNE